MQLDPGPGPAGPQPHELRSDGWHPMAPHQQSEPYEYMRTSPSYNHIYIYVQIFVFWNSVIYHLLFVYTNHHQMHFYPMSVYLANLISFPILFQQLLYQ